MAISPEPVGKQKIGITEDEWRDDPEALAEWDAWINSLEPLEFTAEELKENEEWRKKMKEFNIEAVRRQFAEEPM